MALPPIYALEDLKMDETLPGFQTLFIALCVAFAGVMLAYIPSKRLGVIVSEITVSERDHLFFQRPLVRFAALLGVILGTYAQLTSITFLFHQLQGLEVMEVKNQVVLLWFLIPFALPAMVSVARCGYFDGRRERP